jgi:hypothetical protein
MYSMKRANYALEGPKFSHLGWGVEDGLFGLIENGHFATGPCD